MPHIDEGLNDKRKKVKKSNNDPQKPLCYSYKHLYN